MNINLIPSIDYIRSDELRGKCVVIIDVLRATSVITTALANGAIKIIPVVEVEEAFARKEKNFLLGGERKAMKIEGFDLTNSPLEYTKEKVEHRTIVMSTTNGTKAIHKAIDGLAKETIAGCMLNAAAIAKYISAKNDDIAILCSGTYGNFSLDDYICAGKIIFECEKIGVAPILDDFSIAAKLAYEGNKDQIGSFIKNASHYKYLVSIGLKADIDYCFREDIYEVIPRIMNSNNGLLIMV